MSPMKEGKVSCLPQWFHVNPELQARELPMPTWCLKLRGSC